MQLNSSLFILIFLWTCEFVDAQIASANIDGGKAVVKNRKGLLEQSVTSGEKAAPDTMRSHYTISFEKKETLTSAPGTKSVLFNSSGSKLYAMNLEGMSVYEFDRAKRKVARVFKFRATRGKGWDYDADTAIESYQEKPVEACFSSNDKILWVSLHNAGGIIPIMVDSFHDYPKTIDSTNKHITVFYRGSSQKDSFDVPLVRTGKTPKIISRTADDKYLLVSNWHSYNVSVLQLKPDEYPYATLVSTIPVASIPRGIAVDDKNDKSYIAIMGGATITVLNNLTWQKQDDLSVASNPRHLVIDGRGRLFVSYNRLAKIACISPKTGKTLFTASTAKQPRTIAISKNKQFLFVTCYSGNMVEVFKINKTGFKKLYSIECKGKPVGVDIYEDSHKLEAWVCNYTNGTINILSFKKH